MRSLLGDRRKPIIILMIASVLSGLTESGILAILAQGAAALVNGSTRLHINAGPIDTTADLGFLLLLALALAFCRLALQGVISVVPARMVAQLQARLRRDVFGAFTRASWSEQSRDREGHLQELLTSQISQSIAGALQATLLIIAMMSFLMLVLSALALNALAAVIVLVAAAGLFALMRPLSRLGSRSGQAASRASLAYAGGVNEAIRLAEEVQVFGVGAAERERVGVLIAGVQAPFYRLQLLTRLVPGVYQSLIYVLVAGALAALYETGVGHFASLGAVVLLLVRAGTYGQVVQGSHQSVLQALPYLERVQQAQRRYADNEVVSSGKPLARVQSLAFDHVTFRYEADRPVLSDLSFEVSRHETIGIVGPTGAGKSTIVQILLGLREPTSGRYLVDGTPAAQFRRDDWYRTISYLPQEPRLLHASVADNIRFFRELDDGAVEQAARLAGIHDEVIAWPDGYRTIVGPRADAVSGGQQQRICLARALAARPEVLILDEPTSALDPHTELAIQESLAAIKHELTLFVIAHRMSTLDICDRVMVVLDGRLEAFDTRSALVSGNHYYRSSSALSAGGTAASDLT